MGNLSIDRGRAPLRAIAATGLLLVATAALVFIAVRTFGPATVPAPAPLRLALQQPEEPSIGGGPDYPFGLALAPDGRRLVFPAARQGHVQLWIRDLGSGDLQPLAGTDEGVLPFWSPDGRAIAFFAGRRLRVITLENGAVQDLAEAPSPRGGVWHPGGDIVFAPAADGGLVRRHGSTGAIDPLTTLDAGAGESSHRLPALLDRGRILVFFVRADRPTRQGLWIAPLDAPADRTRLVGTAAHGLVLDEAIVYASDTALVAQRVDLDSRTLTGRTILLGTPVGHGPQDQLFATAAADVLVFGPPASTLRELRWVDRTGAHAGVVGEPMDAWDVRLSPDGTRMAVARVDPQLGTLDISVYESGQPHPRRVSPAIDADETPVWSPDGHRLAWVSGRRTLTVRGTLATLPELAVRQFEHPVRLTDWSPDGQWLVLSQFRPGTHDDLWLVSAHTADAPIAYVQSAFNERQGAVSPDGRWIAYASDESGRFEIYVDAFPTSGARARLTTGGGAHPRWRADGAELYFRRGSELHAIDPFSGSRVPQAAASERLFDAGPDLRAYDASGDGQRFLLNASADDAGRRPYGVLVNVRSLLRFAP